MTELDTLTKQWLKRMRVVNTSSSCVQDFENGYLFGVIFERLNMQGDKKFINRKDMASIFQNHKNTKDLLKQHFKIDFPSQNIMYKTQELLITIRDAALRYEENKKQASLRAIQEKTLSQSLVPPKQQKLLTLKEKQLKGTKTMEFNQTAKLPKKILQIQKKLQKYREQQFRHELNSLQERKREIEQNNRAIEEHRLHELNKTRLQHEATKQKERRVLEIWSKTEQIKHDRIKRNQELDDFERKKKMDRARLLREEEEKRFIDGLDEFELNCTRQGVELEHDPNNPNVNGDTNFNAVVVMERIKDNIKVSEQEKKERKKRTNRKAIDAEEARIRSEEIMKENGLVDALEKKSAANFQKCKELYRERKYENALVERNKIKMSQKKAVPLREVTEEQKVAFDEELRRNRILYYENEIERLERENKKREAIAQEIVEALLMATIVAQQRQQSNGKFTYSQWKQMEQYFIDFQASSSSASHKRTMSSVGPVPNKEQLQEPSDFQKQSKDFLKVYEDVHQELQVNGQTELGNFIESLIDKRYPKSQLIEKSDVPLYMPMRVGFEGLPLSGKSTQTKKILDKYEVTCIDVKKILQEAVEYAKPPPPQDPKKKKQAKKPEEETPQTLAEKQAFKQLGEAIVSRLPEQNPQLFKYEEVSNEDLVKAIQLKLSFMFPKRTLQERVEVYQGKRKKEQQRLSQALADLEDPKKKKKDSKNPGVEEEKPAFNKFFYSEGFVLENVNLTLDLVRLLERELNGYVPQQEQLNVEGQKIKRNFRLFFPIAEPEEDKSLHRGFFNCLFSLESSQQSVRQRNEGRMFDPVTQTVYHPKFNPAPTDIKGLNERLIKMNEVDIQGLTFSQSSKVQEFYSKIGNEDTKTCAFQRVQDKPLEQVVSEVDKKIQRVLKSEYETLQKLQQQLIVEKAEKQDNQQQQVGKQFEKHEEANQEPVKRQQTSNKDPQAEQPANTNQQISDNQPIQKVEQEQLVSKDNSLKATLIENIECTRHLVDFSRITKDYEVKLQKAFEKMPSQREEFQLCLLSHQRQFVSVINRPDDKAGKILTFQDNYNKLLHEKLNLIKDKQAINHLIEKLDALYESFWSSIESKKNQAIELRKKYIESAWFEVQARKVSEIAKNILQAELDYIIDLLFQILLIQLNYQSITIEPVIQYLCLGVPAEREPIFGVDWDNPSNIIQCIHNPSPRLRFFFEQTRQCLQSVPQWFKKQQQKSKINLLPELQALSHQVITKHHKKVETLMSSLEREVSFIVKEQACYYQALCNKMNDWIVVGIKEENDFAYGIYQQMKKSIQELKTSNVKDLFPNEITSLLKPIQKFTEIPQTICRVEAPFEFVSFKIFLEELKALCYYKNEVLKVNFSRFREYFQKRKRSNLLWDGYLKLDFDTTQQYMVIQGESNFKELALAMLLWNEKILDQESIVNFKRICLQDQTMLNSQTFESNCGSNLKDSNKCQKEAEKIADQGQQVEDKQKAVQDYQKEEGKQPTDSVKENDANEEDQQQQVGQDIPTDLIRNVSGSQSSKTHLSFEELNISPLLSARFSGQKSKYEKTALKEFIFDIMREEFSNKVNISEMVDILRTFNSLQLYRYGDSIMMLNEQNES